MGREGAEGKRMKKALSYNSRFIKTLSHRHVFQHSLSDERLAEGSWQVVLGVLLQLDEVSVVRLQLSVVLEAADLHVQGLGRLRVGHQVQAAAVAQGAAENDFTNLRLK